MGGSSRTMRLAAVQMCSGKDPERNLEKALTLLERAADRGADVIALPENFSLMGSDRDRARFAQDLDGTVLSELRRVARKRGVLVLAGTILESSAEEADRRPYNTSVLLDRKGSAVAVYRKMHLFDVSLPDGVVYRESEVVRPGDEPVVACVEGVGFGLSICYDLRFPELYRLLALRGAQVVFVPAAFTLETGKDHWMPLLRARAIENQVYIVAPAQFGTHESGRVTYGHAAIVDPWGTVLAEAPQRESVVWAEADFQYQEEVRSRVPVWRHCRSRIFSLLHEAAEAGAAAGIPGPAERAAEKRR